MQINIPLNKAFRNAPTKLVPQVVDAEYFDAALEMYPESEGWQAVFDRFGNRYGFFCEPHGLKDDPGYQRARSVSQDLTDARTASPELAAAEAAALEMEFAYADARNELIKAVEAEAALNIELRNAATFKSREGTFVMRLPSGREFTNEREIAKAVADVKEQIKICSKQMRATEDPITEARVNRDKIAARIHRETVSAW